VAGKITAIRVQKRNPNRANVFVDDEFAFGVQMIEAAKLSKGQYLTDEDIASLQQADQVAQAHESALRFLSYRPRSTAEVSRNLQQKGFSEATVQVVLRRLSRAELVDDEAFAEYWIRNRERFRPRGNYALRQELRQKGVSDSIIETSLEGVDEMQNAYQAATQRVDRWTRSQKLSEWDELTLRRKLTGYLRRRGFGYGIVQEVWERIRKEHLDGEPDFDEREDAAIWDKEA
jgi:regulatory protein